MKSETLFALENASWPALLVDGAGSIRAVSKGAKEALGQAMTPGAVLGKTIWSKENDESAEEFFAGFDQGANKSYKLRFKGRDGSTLSYETHVCALRVDHTDLYLLQLFKSKDEEAPIAPLSPPPAPEKNPKGTELRTETHTVMEASLAQKQKLDCAMQLIRTVALDFNNALTSILGHASLMLATSDQKNPLRSSLVEIEKSAQKAAEVANDLAAFSRQDKDTKSLASGNLNEVLRRTVEIFKEKQPESIHWKLDLQNRVYGTRFDEAKMQQVFVKILENAVQAMDSFGTVYASTRNLDLSEPLKDGNARLAPGSYVCVEISDAGAGIPADVLPRIFEPFFTTKKDVGHRGLGLAWVYGIVTNHTGSVAVASEVGKGTSVRIYLPAHKKVIVDQAIDDDLSGNATILLIDDEELLLTMGEMVLTSFGYKVITANNGVKALEIFKEKSREIDLVITDLVMPQMSGRELIERLRWEVPELKVICASGFVRPPSTEEEQNYLQKPFASQDLLRKVKQVLSAEQRA
jgi:two-component system, cell cycle sensor histidine kinase and response regulator CckA